jgi:hypothetical protein
MKLNQNDPFWPTVGDGSAVERMSLEVFLAVFLQAVLP